VVTQKIDVPSCAHVNLFIEDIDLPGIKPKFVMNKNEF